MSEDGSDLVSRLRAKERTAFIEFVRYWTPRFERYLRNHGFLPADAYDLSFSCATHVLMQIEAYKRGTNFKAWVWTVGRNFAEDWRRKYGSVETTTLSPTLTAPEDPPPETDTELPAPSSSGVIALEEAVRKLSDADQTLIRMRHLNGSASFKEIAEALSIEVGAARVRHHRILKQIKDILENDPRIRPLL